MALRLALKGTNFEVLGTYLGKPTASRAIGSAVGRNSISHLVPCHLIIHKSGLATGYRWGHVRKRALPGWEAARHMGNVHTAA